MSERDELVAEIKAKRAFRADFLSRNREKMTELQVKLFEDSLAFWDRLAAHLSAQREGWVLVPKEPTPEMLSAWKVGHLEAIERGYSFVGWKDGWNAMLAAAPKEEK